jgi:hypothetical protein
MYNNTNIFENTLKEQNVNNTSMRLKDMEEIFLSKYYMLRAQSLQVDSFSYHKRRKELNELALKNLKLWKTAAELAIECEFRDLQMFLDNEA